MKFKHQKSKEMLNKKEMKEEFKNLSIEEISQKYNYPQPIAESLYEAAHNIEVDKVTMEQLFREMDECWK